MGRTTVLSFFWVLKDILVKLIRCPYFFVDKKLKIYIIINITIVRFKI